MRPIEWAFAQDVPTAEKLVLVYLASRASTAGVGLMERDRLAAATDYKPRSIQRLLKALRDGGLLEDRGDWYVLGLAKHDDMKPLETLPAPPPAGAVVEIGPRPVLSDADMERATEAMANRMLDVADYLLDQLNGFEARLAHELVRFVAAGEKFHVEHPVAPPEPVPDPVRESDLYKRLIEAGISDELAYSTAKAQLESESSETASEPARATNGAAAPHPGGKGYEDSQTGRLSRVADILGDTVSPDAVALWSALEAEENRHTVAGEVAAFELLYPAIVGAAKRVAPAALEWFLDPVAVEQCRAPWDQDPEPTADEDAELAAEAATMLAEIEAAAHPQCQVQPRVTERGDDGTQRTETIVGYHRRVQQVHRQLQRLKAMGAA